MNELSYAFRDLKKLWSLFMYQSIEKKSSGTREVIFLMNLKERSGEFLLKPLVCIETNTKLSRSRSWLV